MLAALNMKLCALREATDNKRNDDLDRQVDELLAGIMKNCKTLTWEISPTSLYETDIAAGLERMADDIHNLFGLSVDIQPLEKRMELNRNSAALLFRCTKELLVNAAKHSGSRSAHLSISLNRNRVRLEVSDQGKGFDTSEHENGSTSGFGLFSIRERLANIDGSMNIDSQPSQGTNVVVVIPLVPEPGRTVQTEA
jgi:signal transduction histidine kinase